MKHLLSLMMIVGTSVMIFAQDKPATPSSKTPQAAPETTGSGEQAAPSTQGLGAFGKLLPLGQKNIDVKIPSFKDGLPSSLLRAYSMTRKDDENMEMEKMDIRLYGPVRAQDMRVQLITGVYHMPTQVLSSEERSRISREDFDLEGDTMIFDTRTQQGKMTGNVRMTIHDMNSMMGGKPAPVATPLDPAIVPAAPKGQPTDKK